MTRVLVCGGRRFGFKWNELKLDFFADPSQREFMHTTLDELHAAKQFTLLIHGAGAGADTLAELWAFVNSIKCARYPANWGRYRNSAGPRRNRQMLNEGKPELVVAFKGGSGTKNMIDIARTAGVEVLTPGWEYGK